MEQVFSFQEASDLLGYQVNTKRVISWTVGIIGSDIHKRLRKAENKGYIKICDNGQSKLTTKGFEEIKSSFSHRYGYRKL